VPVSDEDVKNKKAEVADLRRQVQEAEAARSNEARSAENEVRFARLSAEEDSLRAQLDKLTAPSPEAAAKPKEAGKVEKSTLLGDNTTPQEG
jgi:hypothetical protein